MRVGNVQAASRPGFDDHDWTEVGVPCTQLLEGGGKNTTVWLRKQFALPHDQDPSKLSIDLGARVGTSVVYLNGRTVAQTTHRNAPVFLRAPLVLAEQNTLAIKLTFGSHVGGVRWTGEAAMGESTTRHRGLVYRQFTSSIDGSAQTIAVYIPRGASGSKQRLPLVVALVGWDGTIDSFTHSSLMVEAERRGWFVLVPDRRGNTLYTGPAEEGVLEAIDLISADLPIDPDRVYLTGVSMGGAGALQIGYHFPDRFAALASFYGDSRYSLQGYVRGILHDQATADRYSVLLFPENARNLPVLLVHALDDRVSAFEQSQLLSEADGKSGFSHHKLIAPKTGGHSLQVVEDNVRDMMDLFAASRRPSAPERVTFRTNASRYTRAYWVTVQLGSEGTFGEVDVSFERQKLRLVVHKLGPGLRSARFDLHALQVDAGPSWEMMVEERTPDSVVHLAGLQRCASVVVHAPGEGLETIPVRPDGSVRLARLPIGLTTVQCELKHPE